MKDFLRKLITLKLKFLARLVLYKYKPKIVAVTGSVGKTSTKDAVYSVISKISHVRKSEKSYNSQIGLPLTVLGVPNAWGNLLGWFENILKGWWLVIWPHKYPKWLVLEVGVGKPGDMHETASWLKTDAVIITAIGDMPPHIEFFESRENLIEEKSGLIKTLKKEGLLVLNHDDEAVKGMANKTKSRIVTYGFTEGSDVLGSGESISYNKAGVPEGIIFRADVEGASLPVVIDGVFGHNHIYASLAALALTHGEKWNMLEAIEALRTHDSPPGRMRLLPGINGALIIDDTYNSSPFAARAALKTLGEVKGTRKIAVLADMLELGRHTTDAHKEIGRLAKEVADTLVVVGPRAQDIKAGALEAGMSENKISEFSNSIQTGDFLKTFIKAGDIILIKGSQGMRMERAVGEILKAGESKAKSLVRHDSEWLKKE